ncbi:FIST N domain protein, partial [Vibrio parahaemolyticus V-223/04]|jgi:hypothetical protein
MFH